MYSFLEHTADVRMKVENGTLPGLFTEALRGMFTYLKPTPRGAKEVERVIELSAPDSTALLVDFLNEALSLAQSHKEAYDSIHFDKLVGHQIKARLQGYKVKNFTEDIKAVTYHEAKVEHIPKSGWRAHIIFDI